MDWIPPAAPFLAPSFVLNNSAFFCPSIAKVWLSLISILWFGCHVFQIPAVTSGIEQGWPGDPGKRREPSWETSAEPIPLYSQKGTLAAEPLSQEKSKFFHPWHLLSLCQGQSQASFLMSRNLPFSLGRFFFCFYGGFLFLTK